MHTEWPGEWLRGVLEVCVLRTLADGPTYGYAISSRLEEAGIGAVKGGTLYPLLTRLERSDLVDVQWRTGASGPARKYYTLTAAGRAELAEQAARWVRFADLTRGLVGDIARARADDGPPAPADEPHLPAGTAPAGPKESRS